MVDFKSILSTMFIVFILYSNTTLLAVNNIPEHLQKTLTVQYMMQNANLGTTFYIAIPQNDIKSGQREEILGIYVSSYTDTKVKLSYPRLGIEKTRDVKAFKPTVFSSVDNDASFSWEITESEVINGDAIILTSDAPIAVFVLSSKDNSSDGYLAIPTSAWGKKYVHSAYYDHREGAPFNIRRGAGFIVIAAHDGTGVTIKLNGVGGELGTTVGLKKIGETININLKAGQTYMVRGNGANTAFDLTGTTIEATKPIGVISYHQRTMVPNKCPNGRDHLNEMLLPVESWGTEFVSLEFNRGGQGDFFRVVAFEDNTRIVADQYNAGSGNLLPDGHIETVLNKGQFWEYLQTICGTNNKQNGVRGVTVWKSDKPIQIMQLAYSFPWDQDANWDPLMIAVPPVKQFQKSAILIPAVESGFFNNEITFFAEGEPEDLQKTLLNTIEIDGEKLSKNYPQYMYNNIPGTNLYWGRFKISEQVHSFTSLTKIGGYITGFSGYNSFGAPAMMGTNKIDELDTLAPALVITNQGCGKFKVSATEIKNELAGAKPQKDQGIRNIYLIKEASENYNLTINKIDKFFPELFIVQQDFTLDIIDITKDAKAYFLVGDRAGNFIIDSVEYKAPKLLFSTNKMEFSSKKMYKEHSIELLLKNTGDKPLNINSLILRKAIRYKIQEDGGTLGYPKVILPNDSLMITITFSPINSSFESDSLIIATECINYAIGISGTGIYPKITTENWNAGNIEVGKTICFEDINEVGIRISNEGSDTLHITGIKEPQLPFKISNPTEPELPIALAPSQVIYLKSLCFAPLDSGKFNSELIFLCDDNFGDTVTVLQGSAFIKPINVDDDNNSFKFTVNPNPVVNDEMNIMFTLLLNTHVLMELYSIEGKFIQEILNSNLNNGTHNFNYKTQNLTPGVYYIKFTTDNSSLVKKFVIK